MTCCEHIRQWGMKMGIEIDFLAVGLWQEAQFALNNFSPSWEYELNWKKRNERQNKDALKSVFAFVRLVILLILNKLQLLYELL